MSMESSEFDQVTALMSILKFERIIAFVIGFAFIIFLTKGVEKLSGKIQHSYPMRRVLFLQIATILNFILYIGGSTLLIYAVLQPPKEVLLAVAGSAAVAIGISLKDIVASVVAGVVLLFDRPFQVGDRVTFGETYGEIVGIGLRTVKLTTLDDNLVTIPNARFLTDTVASGNAGELDMMVMMDFHVAIGADIDLARDLIREVIATSRFAYLKKSVTVLTSEVAIAERFAIRLRAKAYVIDCRFEKDFESDVVSRVVKLMNKKEIARPQRA